MIAGNPEKQNAEAGECLLEMCDCVSFDIKENRSEVLGDIGRSKVGGIETVEVAKVPDDSYV